MRELNKQKHTVCCKGKWVMFLLFYTVFPVTESTLNKLSETPVYNTLFPLILPLHNLSETTPHLQVRLFQTLPNLFIE